MTNAHQHGQPPVTVRVWEAGGDLVATVHDTGTGTQDPYCGLVSAHAEDRPGGYGLWLTHQMCDDVIQYTDNTGFTIRMTARRH